MHSFIYSGMFWNEQLFDTKDKFDARDTVIKNSPEGRCLLHGTFSHRQCGKTDDWLRKVISLTKRTVDEVARDFLNKWTSGTESSALSTQILEIINSSEKDPLHISMSVDKYMMRWYINKDEIDARLQIGHYILGLDSSNAVGRDANGLTLTDVRDMSVVATSTISEASIHKYAIWIADFLINIRTLPSLLKINHQGKQLSILLVHV